VALRKLFNLSVIALLASCMSFLPSVWAASGLNYVAMAGKQRMLSQRVLKAYAQMALGVMPDKASLILGASLTELKSNNAILRGQAKNIDLARVQAQENIINRLGSVTVPATTAESVQQAADVSEELLANAELVTQGFIKASNEAPSALVNLAAKQRMLSQRAAAAFLVYQIVPKTPEIKSRALKAASDFNSAIKAFEDAKTEFPQIAEQIEGTRLQMVFFQNALSNIDNPPAKQYSTIATSSERILSEMEAMTSEIVKQLAQQTGGKN
jgi:hypothetical protein